MAERQSDAPTLTQIAETDAIRRLLSGVVRRERKPEAPPAEPPTPPEPAAPETRPPDVVFVAETELAAPVETPPPLPERPAALIVHPEVVAEPLLPPTPEPVAAMPEPAPVIVEPPPPVPMPVGALTFGALLQRINWRNRPDVTPPMPLIGVPDPPGHADTVGAVLAAFSWDDE